MPRVTIGPAQPVRKTIDVEIAHLSDLDVGALRARWHTVFGRPPSPHLPRHLLFRVLAYRLQADRFGDLDIESRRLLDGAGSPEDAAKRAMDPNRLTTDLRPGTMLAREWNGRMQRVAVLADGFAWNGKTYPSLSKVAQAITGTRWNGPRFFGWSKDSLKSTAQGDAALSDRDWVVQKSPKAGAAASNRLANALDCFEPRYQLSDRDLSLHSR
jgi:hypothetical protein